MNKCKMLKQMLESDELEFLMEAHSGISAVIAEEAGFRGLWASGLSVSAMTGCRDRNELDLSEVCKVIEWMADHTSLPILVDGDTGGVDVNAARIMVNKLTKAGAAGVCIEDKLFPKHNSFQENGNDDLADPVVHCAKIKAMKTENPEFVVIARLEEFIAGVGVEEAIRRAKLYEEAGADAILVHSKIKDSSEIDEFMKRWDSDCPIVIVPTKYYTTPTDHFREIGISLCIWANHNMRASISAMQKVSEKIYKEQSLTGVEDSIASVSEIFRLQRDDDKFADEITTDCSRGSAIILSGINDKTFNVPKSLIKINNKTIEDYQRSSYLKKGITNVVTVLPYKDSDLEFELGSMVKGLEQIDEELPIFISYGDLVFKDYVLDKLGNDGDIVIAVDPNYIFDTYNEYVLADKPYDKLSSDNFTVIGFGINDAIDYHGVFVGLIKINTSKGYTKFAEALKKCDKMHDRFNAVMHFLMLSNADIRGVYITEDSWVDINTYKDVIKAGEIK